MSTYVCSDLHGFYSVYEKINAKLSPADRVICLGDATDRGPRGWELLKDILDNPQWTYILGNHDAMVMKYIVKRNCREQRQNGGLKTQTCIENDTPENVEEVLSKLENCPVCGEFINKKGETFYFSHSGYYAPLDSINAADREKMLWDREDGPSGLNSGYDYVVHGHTPAQIVRGELVEVNMFCPETVIFNEDENSFPLVYGFNNAKKGKKVDVDCGIYFSGKAVLLNLDTMQGEVIAADESTSMKLFE